MGKLRVKVKAILEKSGTEIEGATGDRAQPLQVRLIQALLRAAGDPDAEFYEDMARGVPLGVVGEMPRTPAVFEEKTAWNVAPPEEGQVARTVTNYSSAQARPDVILKQFEEDAAEDMMVRVPLSKAKAKYGDKLLVAALGAIQKSVEENTFRIIHDGTHGVMANNRIRPRDQLRYPGVGDIQAVMHQLAAKQVPHFMLLFDVRKAHRLVPVREEDWGYQACLVDGDFDEHGEQQVWLNKVGTFGMSSAAYWWGQVAAGAIRAAHHMLGSRLAAWALLFADDGNLFAEMEHAPRSLVGFLLVMEILGVPLSWKKVRGGIESDFVGYWLDVRNYRMGLSEGRAAWIQKWATEQVNGRLGYGADPQRGFGTAGFRFRTSPVVATLPRTLLCMDVGMSSESFPAFASHAEIDPGVDRGVHHFAALGLLQVAPPTGTGRDLPCRRKG